MIAISSLVPPRRADEIDRNQARARHSWNPIFELIAYVNNYDVNFGMAVNGKGGPTVVFLKPERDTQNPSIKLLANFAAHPELIAEEANAICDKWAAIINADIIVDPRASKLESELNRVGADCGFSLRFAPGEYRVKDLGIDFFFAKSSVWKKIAEEFPESYQIGKSRWDTSMLAHMVNLFPQTCWDITPCRLIFHNPHGNRGDQAMDIAEDDRFINRIQWPKQKLIY